MANCHTLNLAVVCTAADALNNRCKKIILLWCGSSYGTGTSSTLTIAIPSDKGVRSEGEWVPRGGEIENKGKEESGPD